MIEKNLRCFSEKFTAPHYTGRAAVLLAARPAADEHIPCAPNPPSRPQAKQRCASISGSGAHSPSGSPEGSALWCTPHRRGSPEGSALWCTRVQGSALPLSAQDAAPARGAYNQPAF